jgi:hypothetical protein
VRGEKEKVRKAENMIKVRVYTYEQGIMVPVFKITRIYCKGSMMGREIRKSNRGVNMIRVHCVQLWRHHYEAPHFMQLIT